MAAQSGHKLTLLYLANDVVQNCRKKQPEIEAEFGLVMKKVQGCADLFAGSRLIICKNLPISLSLKLRTGVRASRWRDFGRKNCDSNDSFGKCVEGESHL